MVKFEVEISDNIWKGIRDNDGIVAMLIDSLDTIELNDEELFSELCGYIDIGTYGDIIDIRENMTVKKLD